MVIKMDKADLYCELYSRKISYILFHRMIVLTSIFIIYVIKIVNYFYMGKSIHDPSFVNVIFNSIVCFAVLAIFFFYERYSIGIWTANILLCIACAADACGALFLKINSTGNLALLYRDSRDDLTGLNKLFTQIEHGAGIIFISLAIILLLISISQLVRHHKLFFYSNKQIEKAAKNRLCEE